MKTGVDVGPCSGRLAPAWQEWRGPPAPRPTTPPHGAMQRGRRRRGKSGGPPRPREQIRLPQEPVSAGKLPRQIRLGRVEPFPSHPDKTLPGTLHHSGNRPAPPSDHTPLARRSAFQRGWKRGRRGNSNAPVGLNYLQREAFCRALRAAKVFFVTWNHGTLRFHSRSCGGVREIP